MVIQQACTCQELHSCCYLSLRGGSGRFMAERGQTLCSKKSFVGGADRLYMAAARPFC